MLTTNVPQIYELNEVVINTLSEGIYLVDTDKNILVWNESAEKITGYTQEEILGQHCAADLLDHVDNTGAQVCSQSCPIAATMRDGRHRDLELFLRHKLGYRVPVAVKIVPVYAEGEIVGALTTFIDTSRHESKENLFDSLSKLMMTDQLTGLSNKQHTLAMLASRLNDMHRESSGLSVIFINLDEFSLCDGEFGYEAGNDLLVCLASLFRDKLRDCDFIGRWSGEEFVGVFETNSQEHLKRLSEDIRQMIELGCVNRADGTVSTTASIGATMAGSEDGVGDIIDRAVSLMHVSKISGKNCVTIG